MAPSQDELEALKAQVAQLTARIYKLEQQAGLAAEFPQQKPIPDAEVPPQKPVLVVEESAPKIQDKTPPVKTISPLPPLPTIPQWKPATLAASKKHDDSDLEKKIGQYWLNRIGIVAILVGVSYFLKYAFENNWIGPGGRVAIGLLAGIALILWSERFRSHGHRHFSYSLKAVGIGTLYLSLWGAYQIYHLVPSGAAFVAMILVTASTITLALTQDAEILAAFALIGGFSTPVLLSTGENHEIVLFSYVALLDLAILVLAIGKPWRRLLWGSFAGTLILYSGWYSTYYSNDQRGVTVFFALWFAAIFAIIPLVTPYERSTQLNGPSITLTFLPLVNAAVVFFELFAMYHSETETLTWYALALAAAYLTMSHIFKQRFTQPEGRVINLIHVAIAIAFITIAIPLKLNGHWITIGWLVESAALLWVSVKMQTDVLRYFAVVALALGICRLLLIDNFRVQTLLFNARFATYLIAIAILAGIIIFGQRAASDKEHVGFAAAGILLNVLALVALTLEALSYFDNRLGAAYQAGYMHDYHELRLARDFSLSAIWLGYGAALMMFGFRRQSAFVRWQALILMTITIGKVFLFDISELGGSYRILSFIALGAVLLGISFVYQRDWLKLSPGTAKKSASGISG